MSHISDETLPTPAEVELRELKAFVEGLTWKTDRDNLGHIKDDAKHALIQASAARHLAEGRHAKRVAIITANKTADAIITARIATELAALEAAQPTLFVPAPGAFREQ